MEALKPNVADPGLTLLGVSRLSTGMSGRAIPCTIDGFCRTQAFEFPGIKFHPVGETSHMPLYLSETIRAHVTADLLDYFQYATCSNHYSISPCLRHEVDEVDRKARAQHQDSVPVFIVFEEVERLTPLAMINGECQEYDEVVEVDGEETPMIPGGRRGEQFIAAWQTSDGVWPDLPNNQLTVNLALAAVRVGQKTDEPIRKPIEQSCLVTDDGQFVNMRQMNMSGRLSLATNMETADLQNRVSEISGAIRAMHQDKELPHTNLLVNAMYNDDYKDDAYRRLQYLGLWQSLVDAAKKPLGYDGNIRNDKVRVAGNHSLVELKEYRDEIAHMWTETIDENYLADLQQTINELMWKKYF